MGFTLILMLSLSFVPVFVFLTLLYSFSFLRITEIINTLKYKKGETVLLSFLCHQASFHSHSDRDPE